MLEMKQCCQPCEGKQSFECVLATLTTSLINADSETLGARLEAGLGNIVRYLGIDQGSIWLIDEEIDQFKLTHQWAVEEIMPVPPDFDESNFPYFVQQIRMGELTIVERIADLPEEAVTDIESLRILGEKSVAVIPLLAGDGLLGAIAFSSYHMETRWPSACVTRLQLISGIFANSFLKHQREVDLQCALGENIQLRKKLEVENKVLQDEVFRFQGYKRVVGQSPSLRRVMREVDQVAQTNSAVLLLGETGTGKDLIASHVHQRSQQAHRPLVRVNCAALPETLFESELFGHEKGAFTGAVDRKIGRFESADGGTLVLDEIGEIPLECQSKLLRALESGEFERLGSSQTREANVRIITSTNRNLKKMVTEGRFRSDLFYRINVFPITIPPLRERKEDIPMLVKHFVEKLQRDMNKEIAWIPDETMAKLVAYSWPGNIRELQNIVERSLILSPGMTLSVVGIQNSEGPLEQVSAPTRMDNSKKMPPRTLDEMNREYIRSVCKRCGWKIHGKGNAADLLDINPNTLRARMKKLRVERPLMVN